MPLCTSRMHLGFSAVLILLLHFHPPSVAAEDDVIVNTTATTAPPLKPHSVTSNTTVVSGGSMVDWISENTDMVKRATFVLLGLTVLVIVYFAAKYACVRRSTSKTMRRYDVLPQRHVESALVLDSDSDDDIFDANAKLVKP